MQVPTLFSTVASCCPSCLLLPVLHTSFTFLLILLAVMSSSHLCVFLSSIMVNVSCNIWDFFFLLFHISHYQHFLLQISVNLIIPFIRKAAFLTDCFFLCGTMHFKSKEGVREKFFHLCIYLLTAFFLQVFV